MEDTARSKFEIPMAQSPDWVSSLLSFETCDLEDGQTGSDWLVARAAELRGWELAGQHPRYTVSRWIEVLITGAEAHCRIFNCRTHHTVRPLTLQGLLEAVTAAQKELEAHQTPLDFGQHLLEVYDALSEQGEEVKLLQLFRELQKRFPAYRREHFGLDLFFAIENGALQDREASLLAGGNCPRTELFTLGEATGPQIVHRLLLSPQTELQSLDI